MCLHFRNAIHLKFPTQFQLEAVEWFGRDKAVIHNIFYQEQRQNWYLSLLLLLYHKSLIFSSPEIKVYQFPHPKHALSPPPRLFQNLPLTTSTDEKTLVTNHSWPLNYGKWIHHAQKAHGECQSLSVLTFKSQQLPSLSRSSLAPASQKGEQSSSLQIPDSSLPRGAVCLTALCLRGSSVRVTSALRSSRSDTEITKYHVNYLLASMWCSNHLCSTVHAWSIGQVSLSWLQLQDQPKAETPFLEALEILGEYLTLLHSL